MSYWSDRQDELYAKLEKEEEKLKKRIADFYRRESRKLEGKISSFYSRYGENNIIEYRKLMEKLDDDDLSLLIEAMDDFAEKYPEYAHLMPIRENIYKLNRLEGLQTSIRMQQLEIGAINNQELTDHLTKQSHRAVNTAAEALGFGKNFYSINSDVVKMFVDAVHTNGKNYSERIWGNTEKLTEYLCTDMAQAFARGDSYQNIIKHMKERFEKVARNDMYRLIYTEGTYIMAHATMKPFEEDFELYKVSTAGDSKVCQTCRKVAEQVFNINEKVSGTNFPPFHAWCRCTWEVYVEDWDKWMDDYVEKHGNGSERQAKKIKDRLDDVTSVEDVEQLFKERDWFYHYMKDGNDYRSDSHLNLKGSDLESAKKIYEAYNDLFTKYPQMKNKLAPPTINLIKGAMAECYQGFGRGAVRLNSQYYCDYNKILFVDKTKDKWLISTYIDEKNYGKCTIMHELGHAIDDYLTYIVHYNGVTGDVGKTLADKMRPKILKSAKITKYDISKEVSQYATHDAKEFWAECFAEYMYSDNPRKVAATFGAILDEIMKEVK